MRFDPIHRKWVLCAFVALGVAGGGALWIDRLVDSESASRIHERIDDVPPVTVALVPGARVYDGGGVSAILEDRLLGALDLYRAGKVRRLLLSGDHGRTDYDEVNAMKRFLLERGVRSEEVFLDHAGFDTYDSVIRARSVFQVRDLVIVTQRFHLPRAVWIATRLGMSVNGLVADRHPYAGAAWYRLREIAARVKAWLDVSCGSSPKFYGPVIPIDGDGRKSWD